MIPRAVIFDFDYTLADSSPGVIDCVRTAQARMGLALSEPEAIRRTIGLSVPDTLAALAGEGLRPRADEFGRRFRERADEVMADNTVVYAAVPAVLRRLRHLGAQCAIATTKFRYRIEAILRREGLDGLVDVVVGAEDVAAHKPDPACLTFALDRLGVPAGAALYVGDSLPDAEAARRAGIPFAAVRTGPTPACALRDRGPIAILDSVADLPAWLAATPSDRETPRG